MTQITASPPVEGYETDRRIAERVMGWAIIPDGERSTVFPRVSDLERWLLYWPGPESGAEDWSPSTNHGQACQIVDRMRELGWRFLISDGEQEAYRCGFRKADHETGEGESEAEAPTLALAVCRAALGALERG